MCFLALPKSQASSLYFLNSDLNWSSSTFSYFELAHEFISHALIWCWLYRHDVKCCGLLGLTACSLQFLKLSFPGNSTVLLLSAWLCSHSVNGLLYIAVLRHCFLTLLVWCLWPVIFSLLCVFFHLQSNKMLWLHPASLRFFSVLLFYLSILNFFTYPPSFPPCCEILFSNMWYMVLRALCVQTLLLLIYKALKNTW